MLNYEDKTVPLAWFQWLFWLTERHRKTLKPDLSKHDFETKGIAVDIVAQNTMVSCVVSKRQGYDEFIRTGKKHLDEFAWKWTVNWWLHSTKTISFPSLNPDWPNGDDIVILNSKNSFPPKTLSRSFCWLCQLGPGDSFPDNFSRKFQTFEGVNQLNDWNTTPPRTYDIDCHTNVFANKPDGCSYSEMEMTETKFSISERFHSNKQCIVKRQTAWNANIDTTTHTYRLTPIHRQSNTKSDLLLWL